MFWAAFIQKLWKHGLHAQSRAGENNIFVIFKKKGAYLFFRDVLYHLKTGEIII